ncbi:MAG TPA: DoxX family membrane protein [Cyclobacteriaceae bacterium]|nr:DoxX family membrane protein [Cyclobacteriaceae bacterium]
MLFSTRIASMFFAIALIGLGIIHFLLGDFVAGRAPSWPEGIPGKMIWAYTSGVILIVAAIAIFSNQKTRLAVTCAGVMILFWAGGRNLVALLTSLDYGGLLTNTGKALTIGSGALLIASTFKGAIASKDAVIPRLVRGIPWQTASVLIGLFFLASGIQHFLFIDFVKTLVPRWIPGDVFWSYVAGVGLIAAGIALITGFQRKLAAFISSWMVFIWFLILHLPRGFGETGSFNEWIAIFESLAVSAILAIIYWKEKDSAP